MKITIDETRIKYSRSETELRRWLQKAIGTIPILPPYVPKGFKGFFGNLTFRDFGKSIRIQPASVEKDLNTHKKRLGRYSRLSGMVYFGSAIVLGFLVISYLEGLRSTSPSAALPNLLSGWSFSLMSVVIGLLIAIFATKIAALLVDKNFADSLVILSSLYLVIDLDQSGSLSEPEFKRNILGRIHNLRRNVLLLSQTFLDTSTSDRQDAFWQLKNIEGFIRQRESWVIAPKKDTIELLRKDFEELAIILISGRYGEFESETATKRIEIDPQQQLSFTDGLLQLVFTLFPYVILAVLYYRPAYIVNSGFDVTTVFLVSIAWILITIDARLRLGLVSRVTSLVKTVKELS